MRPDIAIELAGLTDRVLAYRVVRNLKEGKLAGLIEIKGLGQAVAAAKKGIADVRSETAGLQTDASSLVLAIQDVRQQINQAKADLAFEAQTLGNGAPTEQPSEPLSQQGQAPETHTRNSTGTVIENH